MWSLLIVTTCLFFSAKASLRTSTSPSQRNTASHKWRGRVPNSQQFLPVRGCHMRDPGEVCGALQEHPSTGWVVQTHSGLAAGRLRPDLLHPPMPWTSCEGSGWMGSTGGGCDLQNFLLCCLHLFFLLKPGPDYAAKHPCRAGRAGWPLGVPCCRPRRAVAPGPAAGGLPATWACSSVGLAFATCACASISAKVWAEDVVSWAGWLRRRFCPCPGGLQSCRSRAAQGGRTCLALPAPTQSFPLDLDHKQSAVSENWPKKKPRSECCSTKRGGNKPQIREAYSKLHQRGFFYGLSFTWFCTSANMSKAFNAWKMVTAMKFPLGDLPRQHSRWGVFVPS